MKQMPFRTIGRALALGLCVMACGSCGTQSREGRSSSFLVIDNLAAAPGESTTWGNVLHSDVMTKCGIYQDNGQVTLRFSMKDPTSPTGVTTNNEITVTSYHVQYIRADGRNTPGVDVPYPFDGAITGTVKTGVSVQFGFTLVRAQAKIEAPLNALAFQYNPSCVIVGPAAGGLIISTIAEVTFYGRDQAGNQVSVKGTIEVDFADWADPE